MKKRDKKIEKKRKRSNAKKWAQSNQKDSVPYIKKQDGIELFKIEKEGTVSVDILPFIASSKNKNAKEGYEHYETEYETHDVTINSKFKRTLCRGFFKKKCAFCEFIKNNRNNEDVDPEILYGYRPKTRHLWFINDNPGKVKNFKIKIFDTGHFNQGIGFGELLIQEISSKDDVTNFWFPEKGKILDLRIAKKTIGNKRPYYFVNRIDFRKRIKNYSADLASQMPCLDDFLIDPGYEEVENMIKLDNCEE